jgi:hypothetical protein
LQFYPDTDPMMLSAHPFSSGLLLALLVCLLQACASGGPVTELPPSVEQRRVDDLQQAILAMDSGVDRTEARRAARIAIEYPRELARQYEITDPPLLHNVLVNLGVKPRGLCVDWTEDLLVRLRAERFHSLDLHWGIANYQSVFRIEHSTVIISARNQSLDQGVVLDPWRNGGDLFWAPTGEDPSYTWYPQADIHALKRERKALAQNRNGLR